MSQIIETVTPLSAYRYRVVCQECLIRRGSNIIEQARTYANDHAVAFNHTVDITDETVATPTVGITERFSVRCLVCSDGWPYPPEAFSSLDYARGFSRAHTRSSGHIVEIVDKGAA